MTESVGMFKKTVISAAISVSCIGFAPIAIANSNTTGTLAGLTQPESSMSELCPPDANPCQVIQYNNFLPDPFLSNGVNNTIQWINNTPGEKTVVGYSLGGAVITRTIQSNQILGNDVSFITYGNPYVGQTPDSPYQLTEVVNEYDPVADPVDNWWNILALINSGMAVYRHSYNSGSISDPNRVEVTQGNVTYVFVPSNELPLTAWMDQQTQNAINPWLRPMIDSAYERPYLESNTTANTVTSTEGVSSLASISTTQTTFSSPIAELSLPNPTPRISSARLSSKTAQSDSIVTKKTVMGTSKSTEMKKNTPKESVSTQKSPTDTHPSEGKKPKKKDS